MEYTYRGKDYPKYLNLSHQEVFTTLSKDPLDITRREFDHIQDIPLEELTADEESLIMWELGRQWGKNTEQLQSDTSVNPFIIRNTLITLLTSFDESSFDVVLEILRQTEDIISFNLPDYNGFTYILPMLSKIFECEPDLLAEFMLEEGISVRGKQIVAELLSMIGSDSESCCESYDDNYKKKVHKKLVAIFRQVLETYISDYAKGRICDKQVVSHTVKSAVNAGLTELSKQLRIVYDKNMVDQQICGDLNTTLSFMTDLGSSEVNYIETDPCQLMFLPTGMVWAGNGSIVLED